MHIYSCINRLNPPCHSTYTTKKLITICCQLLQTNIPGQTNLIEISNELLIEIARKIGWLTSIDWEFSRSHFHFKLIDQLTVEIILHFKKMSILILIEVFRWIDVGKILDLFIDILMGELWLDKSAKIFHLHRLFLYWIN